MLRVLSSAAFRSSVAGAVPNSAVARRRHHRQAGDGNLGPSERLTVDFSDLDNGTLNIVNGQAGNLLSPYFNDQWDNWYHGTTVRLPFSDDAVDHAKSHELTLTPSK